MRQSALSVLVIDTKLENPNRYIVLGIVAALRANARVGKVHLSSYRTLVADAQATRYDLLIALDGEQAALEIIGRAIALVGRSAFWSWEDPYESAAMQKVAALFDVTFTNDSASVGSYPNATFLPLAAAKTLDYRPVRESAACEYDVSFVGSAWPNRVRFIRALMRARPALVWKLGLVYNEHLPTAYLDLPETDYRQTPSHREFAEIANRSRIVITLHRNFSGSGPNVQSRNPGPRIFEVALAGGHQLVDASETDVGSFFDSGEIDTFSGFENCLTQLDAILGNPALRTAKARAAQARALNNHLYEHRVAQILQRMETVVSRQSPAAVKRPRVLFVTHNVVAAGGFGGVEVYQETIVGPLSRDFEILFYYPARQSSTPNHRDYRLTTADAEIIATYSMPSFDSFLDLSSPPAEETFGVLLKRHRIDLIHFHHLINHCASLPLIAEMMGVPTVYTLQDFFLVCHRFNLLDFSARFCRIDERPKTTTCNICLSAAESRPFGAQNYRRSFIARVLGTFDAIMGNSPTATRIFSSIYPDIADRNVIVSLGLPVPASRIADEERELRGPSGQSRLKVVFLGNFASNKGADLFLRVAAALVEAPVDFTICGRIDSPFDTRLDEAKLPNVRIYGLFSPGELDLHPFDVSLHLSNWPETYCITLSEAWAAGVVPIATDVGALGDRITHDVNGFLVPIDGTGELLALLEQLIGDRSRIESVRSRITSDLWMTAEQHVEVLSPVYERLIAQRPVAHAADADSRHGQGMSLSLSGHPIGAPNWTRPDDLAAPALSEAEPKRLAPLPASLLVRNHLNFSEGRIDLFGRSKVRMLQVGSHQPRSDFDDQVHLLPLKEKLVLSGFYKLSLDTDGRTRALAFRSANDLILRALSVLSPDAAAPDNYGASDAMQFVSEPVSLELFDPDLYSVELALIDESGIELVPTNITIQGGEKPAVVMRGTTGGLSTAPRTSLRRLDWADSAVEGKIGFIARLALRRAEAIGAQFLEFSVNCTGCAASDKVAVRLDGPVTAYGALSTRDDSIGTRREVTRTGAVWLQALPPGRYDISLMQHRSGSITIQRSGSSLSVGHVEATLVAA